MQDLVTLDVLVADDKENELNVTISAIQTIAEKIGFVPKIDTADNVKETIRKAIEIDYDLILIDYDFSKSKTDKTGNGSDVVREVRKLKPAQPVYLFSGEGWLVQLRAKYLWNVPFVKKIWFERKPRRFFKRKQPKDVHTYEHLEHIMLESYLKKARIPIQHMYKPPQTSI